MTRFLTREIVQFPFMKYPKFLQDYDISETCKTTYMLLLDRASLSRRNNWIDEQGRVYIVYTHKSLAEDLKRGETTVKKCLEILEQHGLICKVPQGGNQPNRIYVKMPEEAIASESEGVRKPTPQGAKNRPLRGQKADYSRGQESDTFGDRNLSLNKNNKTRTDKTDYCDYDCEGNSL